MSRADPAARLIEAAIAVGVTRGAGAMSLQGIAKGAGVSKALVLYHFKDKAALLAAVVTRLGERAAARLARAARDADAMAAWRMMVREELRAGEAALLAALAQEEELASDPAVRAARATREEAAAALAEGILKEAQLVAVVAPSVLGRVLIHHLDGIACHAVRGGLPSTELVATLDAGALALLGLGR